MSYPAVQAASRNSAFGALAAAALGFALMETACIQLTRQVGVHLAALLAGSALLAVALRRFLRHWPPRPSGVRGLSAHAALWRVVLAALVGAGAFLAAASLSHGLVTPFIVFTLALMMLPWATFAATRADCLCYGGAAAAGVAGGLLAFGLRFHPMPLLAVAWMLWLSAILGWLRLVLEERQQERRATAW